MPPTESHRQLLHTRQITCRAWQLEGGLIEVEATLTDEKAETVPFRSREPVVPGQYMHHMTLSLVIDGDYTIREVRARTLSGPWPMCGGVDDAYRRLVGLRIGPGFNQQVKQRVGGIEGCTHLTDLLAQIGNTYMQASWPGRIARQMAVSSDPRRWPDRSVIGFVNQCHAWREDGETLRREYPELAGDPNSNRDPDD